MVEETSQPQNQQPQPQQQQQAQESGTWSPLVKSLVRGIVIFLAFRMLSRFLVPKVLPTQPQQEAANIPESKTGYYWCTFQSGVTMVIFF